MKLAKKQRRQLYRSISGTRRAISARSPRWAVRFFGPVVDYLDMLFVDHGIFRVIYPNRHRVGQRAWRASQPTPHQVAYYKRIGVRTILNLRGPRDCGSYRLERAACERHGLKLIDFQLKSRAAPEKELMKEAKDLLESIEYPVVMHCKSGADRVGLMSVLYEMFQHKAPAEKAIEQLDWRYGHFRSADTGVLDFFFDRYIAERDVGKVNGSGEVPVFFEWLDERYDPEELKASFAASGWTNILVNRVLGRE